MHNVNKLPAVIMIGRQTENEVCKIMFDFGEWAQQFPGIEMAVMHKRPGEDAAYPALTETHGTTIVWTVSAADTAIAGFGTVELLGRIGSKRKLSAIAKTHISESGIANTKEPPEAARPWVDQVLEAAQRAEDAAQRAENAGGGNSNGKLDKNQGAENSGKLLYVGPDGNLTPLALGEGLEIVDGVLHITIRPETAEEVFFEIEPDGKVTLRGVELAETDDGALAINGAEFAQVNDGILLIK